MNVGQQARRRVASIGGSSCTVVVAISQKDGPALAVHAAQLWPCLQSSVYSSLQIVRWDHMWLSSEWRQKWQVMLAAVTSMMSLTALMLLHNTTGGMILCGVMARIDTTTAKIRSCIVMGSGLFLEGGWRSVVNHCDHGLHGYWWVEAVQLCHAAAMAVLRSW